MTARAGLTEVALLILVVALFVVSLLVGPAAIGLGATLNALVGGDVETTGLIVREIRLPRAILATMLGATLGLSGAVLQGYLRNPLAEPGVVGVTASAALGAVVAFYFGLSTLFALALPLGGIAGALIGVIIIQGLTGRHAGTLTVILAGVAITSLAGALTALALNLAPNPFAAMEIMFWLMGSLADRSMDHVWLVLPFLVVGWIMLLILARPLDALTLGEETAASLGVNLINLRRLAIVGTALSVGAVTAVAGAVGFVGLVVPHLLRPLVGHRPGRLLLASMLGGAALVNAADIAVRVVAPERDLKLGVVTALIGAPFFFWLLLKSRRAGT